MYHSKWNISHITTFNHVCSYFLLISIRKTCITTKYVDYPTLLMWIISPRFSISADVCRFKLLARNSPVSSNPKWRKEVQNPAHAQKYIWFINVVTTFNQHNLYVKICILYVRNTLSNVSQISMIVVKRSINIIYM